MSEYKLPPTKSTVPTDDENLLKSVAFVHEYMMSNQRENIECTSSYEMTWHDEYGWGDGESPILMWEEGTYGWAYETSVEVNVALNTYGYFAEPVNSWALGFYKI
jgi:hypothetical protein